MASEGEMRIEFDGGNQADGPPLVDQIMSLVNSNQLNLGPGDVIRVINLDGSESETVIEMPHLESGADGYEDGQEVDHVTAEGDAIIMGSDPASLAHMVSAPELQMGRVYSSDLMQFGKGYVCGVCDKRLASAGSLNLHMRIHTGEKPFKCPACDECFARSSFLTYHMRLHTGKNPFSCKDCGAELSSASNLSRHEKLHDEEKPFQCHLCTAAFIQRPHYKEHLRKHTGQMPYKCTECDARFLRSYSLRLHQDKHRAGIYSCDVCNVTFTNMSALRRHQPMHRQRAFLTCTVCKAEFLGPSALHSHMRMHRQHDRRQQETDDENMEDDEEEEDTTPVSDYWCHVCGKDFPERESLRTHLTAHGVQPPTKCPKCDEVYDDLNTLVDHRALGLCFDGDLTCKVCKFTSHRKYDLKRHMKTHLGPQPFSCTRCSAMFARAGNLAAHMTLHTGIAPFKCHVCDVSFFDKRLFSRHFNSHPRDHLPVRCSVCRDRLGNADALKMHMVSYHKRYQKNEEQ